MRSRYSGHKPSNGSYLGTVSASTIAAHALIIHQRHEGADTALSTDSQSRKGLLRYAGRGSSGGALGEPRETLEHPTEVKQTPRGQGSRGLHRWPSLRWEEGKSFQHELPISTFHAPEMKSVRVRGVTLGVRKVGSPGLEFDPSWVTGFGHGGEPTPYPPQDSNRGDQIKKYHYGGQAPNACR